jgi:hypothetical protein
VTEPGGPRRACGIAAGGIVLLIAVFGRAAEPLTIAERAAAQLNRPSVHDEPPRIAMALAAAGVPEETIGEFFDAVGQADLPGMVASIDGFLFLTRDPRWQPLRRHFAEFLELPDVVTIDEAAIGQLAGYEGVVTLPAVRELSVEAAAACGAFGAGDWAAAVELPGISELAPEAAAALARCEALLVLPNLTRLSVATARALATQEGVGVVVGGLESLPADVAAALAETKSIRGLLLPDLTTLDSAPLARRLARQDHAFLPKVTRLSPEIAQALRGNDGGELALPALRELPMEAAEQLVGAGYFWLSLGGAARLTPAAATILSRHNGQLGFPGREAFSAAAATELARHRGSLVLPHVTELPADVARALAAHTGPLVLPSLADLPDELARELGRHAGPVILPAVRRLSAAAARGLVAGRGSLSLPGLEQVSAEAFDLLRATPGIELPPLEALEILAAPAR